MDVACALTYSLAHPKLHLQVFIFVLSARLTHLKLDRFLVAASRLYQNHMYILRLVKYKGNDAGGMHPIAQQIQDQFYLNRQCLISVVDTFIPWQNRRNHFVLGSV